MDRLLQGCEDYAVAYIDDLPFLAVTGRVI